MRTRFGWSEVFLSYRGLLSLSKPRSEIVEGYRYHELEEALELYFSGEKVEFLSFPIDLSPLSHFQRAVLDEVRKIKWGEFRCYQEIGEMLGNKGMARAVGQVLASNPLPIIIPCHRVIRKDGSLGDFSWGVEWKRFLLGLEGIRIK